MTINLAADAAVAVLLLCTIYYAAKLNRRLTSLRADKAELQALVQHLAAASASAEGGVKGLKSAAEEIGRQLDKRVQEAQALREDLSYMIERGGTVADRLETSLRTRRDPPAEPPLDEPRTAAASRRSPAHREPSGHREPSDRAASLSAARLAQRIVEEPVRAAPGAPSRAERDLLRVLAGRR